MLLWPLLTRPSSSKSASMVSFFYLLSPISHLFSSWSASSSPAGSFSASVCTPLSVVSLSSTLEL